MIDRGEKLRLIQYVLIDYVIMIIFSVDQSAANISIIFIIMYYYYHHQRRQYSGPIKYK